ncbi:MAG: methylglyoxal synthase [bacterium]|jgi:methylglyoxal synthase
MMIEDKFIALIAHDGKKPNMVSLVMNNLVLLKKHKIVATGTTGSLIKAEGLTVTLLESGPKGGDAQIATMAVEGKLKCVIFLVDPLDVHPHQVDVSMLLRICNVHNVPLATNVATAELLIKELNDE